MAFLPADFMFHSHDQDDHSPSTSLNILPPYPPHDFHGVGPFHMKRSMSFNSGVKMFDNHQEQVAAAIMHGDMDELSDDEGSQAGDHNSKKKRLNLEQVKALEKSFDLGNKLEPERKMQLARALNLQPRQVAIWFQNRRARWKTKQLERDYDLLKKQFEAVKADNDALHAQNKKLHAELLALRNGEPTRIEGININKKETEGSLSNGSENSSDHHVNLDMSRTPVMNNTQLSCKQLFPSSFIRPTSITQLLQSSTRSDLQCPKIDQIIQDESFCNMFCGIDDQSGSGIWPWPEQNQFQ